ncbi:trehalose-6-phosphate hydrolase [Corynebacterium pollutisoli]|uniref:Trehalose-6-phosphate hydrolase n=1 Tax=Corynebacterium pollutisoli TaxID=1610489 RepID=A0A1X7KD77_9CORY|nr:alpha,alpha-phosphotrehalase [Corynebacterium pollutisoli]SMG38863.1 trehalose-6-phosphate hydrolase [Corynebacterium pollutisoli]
MDGRTVIYQIYPKSFQDSTGDGVGDIRGIINRIPYLAELGPDMIWFSPFFVSPQRDNGYDVADYRAIDPVMGTMAEVEEMIAGLAEHDIGVMFDMVFNHTSTEHEWFRRALAGDPSYRDYYIIRPSAPDGGPPTNWESKFGGSAWAPFGDTGDWYLHLFDITQADLNWRNPAVRREMADIVNFWLDKGVRGFRFDVINLIGKKEELLSSEEGVDPRVMYTDGEDVHPYLQELRRESFGRVPGTVTVGEMSSTSIERCVAYSNPANGELDMVFNFHHLKVDYPTAGEKWALKPYDSADLKRVLNDWAEGMQEGGGWNALFLNNHDQPRAVGRFGDAGDLRVEAATMLATLTHGQRGTPFIYQGEEIGMTDPEYTSIDDYVDVEAHNAYHSLLDAGLAPAEAFDIVHARARDNGRTPVQWDDSPTAGFTTGVPWLAPTNQDRINVADELATGRIFRHYQDLIALRRTHPAIAEGTYEAWEREHPAVHAFLRTHDDEELLVVCNLTANPQEIPLPEGVADGTILSDNYPGTSLTPDLPLQPYQALVIAKGAQS